MAFYALEQFRLKSRVVRFQVQRLVRVEPDLLPAIGQDDNRSLMGLGNQFRQLPLSFSNSQSFHVRSLSRNARVGKPIRRSQKSPTQSSARGSQASRRASPTKFSASSVTASIAPGNTISHQ
jgi:hypothetical protein